MNSSEAQNSERRHSDLNGSNAKKSDALGSDAERTNGMIHLRLYIASGSRNSVNALANLKLICQRDLGVRFEVEVVDIWQEPGRALSDGILLTPSLRRLSPLPEINIIGDLSDIQAVINALDLTTQKGSHPEGLLGDFPGKSSENSSESYRESFAD